MTQEVMFDGTDLRREDHSRLRKQFSEVQQLMSDGKWRTLREIGGALRFPEASVSARLRDMRKPKFGAYVVERRRVMDSTYYEYRVIPRAASSKNRLDLKVVAQLSYQQRLEEELRMLRASKKCSHCKKQLDLFE